MRRLVPELNSSWIEGGGQPPRTPMTTVAWDMIDAPKSEKSVAEKNETFFRKILGGEPIDTFRTFFKKTYRRTSSWTQQGNKETALDGVDPPSGKHQGLSFRPS